MERTTPRVSNGWRSRRPAELLLPPCQLETTEGHLVSFDDRLGEQVVKVEPKAGEPRANLLWIHGLSDHSARQLETARWLADRGYRTVLFDTVGHGGRGSRRSASFWVTRHYLTNRDAGSIERAIRDDPRFNQLHRDRLARDQFERLSTATFDQHIRQVGKILDDLPHLIGADFDLPLFLVGHSLGALIAIETTLRRADTRIRGVVLLSPALEPQGNPESPAQKIAVEAFWRLRRSPLSPARAALKTALRANFAVDSSWGNRWVSDQPEEVRLFGSDPLIPSLLPTRYASNIESQMVHTDRRALRFPVPGLVVVPGEDGITKRSAGIRFARRVAASQGRQSFRIASFDGVRAHDLLRSSARNRVRSLVADWLDERSAAAATSRNKPAA